ncbi:MAG: hypothetical protein ACPGVT_08970 [Maricaulaceae bacterium]
MTQSIHKIDDILMPLALAVIIDNKVKEREIAEFVQQGQGLLTLFGYPSQSSDNLRHWFSQHENSIIQALNGPRKNTFVLRALSIFSEDVYVENIFDAMVQVSLSDQQYLREESDLIKSAASLWGYNRPPIKVED